MESENDQEAKAFLVGQIWQEGIKKAGALKLTGGTDDELYQIWMETIDLLIEQFYESPDDFNEWKQQSPTEKYKVVNKELVNFEGFKGEVQSIIDFMKIKLSNTKQAEDENTKNIILRAFSRAANREVERSGIDLEPGKELISSEKITELGITKKKLLDSLNMDPQVKAADCVEGEFIVTTISGEVKFRLVFGDEASGGKA